MKVISINKMKSEAPLMAIFFVFALIVSLIFYPIMLGWSLLIFPLVALVYLLGKRNKIGFFRKQYFWIIDEEGMNYCFHVFQQPKRIKWELVDKVNFQMYEINFHLKDDLGMVSIELSNLADSESQEEIIEEIKKYCQSW